MLTFTDELCTGPQVLLVSYIADIRWYACVYFHALYSVYHVNITMLIICIKDNRMMLCYFWMAVMRTLKIKMCFFICLIKWLFFIWVIGIFLLFNLIVSGCDFKLHLVTASFKPDLYRLWLCCTATRGQWSTMFLFRLFLQAQMLLCLVPLSPNWNIYDISSLETH